MSTHTPNHGFDRANYEWPRITAIHPGHGSYQMDVHCVRNPETGALVLIAFQGTNRSEQVDLVLNMADRMGDVIEPLYKSDISPEMGELLAAHFYAHPDAKVGVVQVQRPRSRGLEAE